MVDPSIPKSISGKANKGDLESPLDLKSRVELRKAGEGASEGDKVRFVEGGVLNAFEAHLLGDGT